MNNWVKTIFRHDTEQGGTWYSVAVAGKDGNGEKTFEYWPVDFPQGTQIMDRSKVEFKDFFVSYFTKRDGTIQHKFVVNDFLIQQPTYQQQPQIQPSRPPQGYPQPVQYGQPANVPYQQPYPPQQQPQQTQYYNGQGYAQPYQPAPAPQPQMAPAQPQAQPPAQPQQQQMTDFEQIDEDVPF